MTVSELMSTLSFDLLTPSGDLTLSVNGCYIGDLLSWVMGRAKENDAWITVMSNANIVAVAALCDVSCIILAEEVTPGEDVLQKAEEQGIVILRSKLPAYETALKIHEVL